MTTLTEIAPGAVHAPGWLTPAEQRQLVDAFRAWSTGPMPLRSASVRGHRMSVQTVCLGWHWQPYRYSRHAHDVNGERALPLPDWLVDLARRGLDAVGWPEPATYRPDTALINPLTGSRKSIVCGGPARLAYHGVTTIIPGTAPEGCGLAEGRISVTLRATGLNDVSG